MPPDENETLEARLRAEAERHGDTIDEARRRLVLGGLEAIKADRARERQASHLRADVLLVTATRTEHTELMAAAADAGITPEARKGRFGRYYHFGRIGSQLVASIQVGMGAFAPDGAAARCFEARAETRATMFILVGTAFGVDPSTQRIADVLVSHSVFVYDDREVDDVDGGSAGAYRISWPTANRPASPGWVERFERVRAELSRLGESTRVEVGTVLSGGARISSAAYRDELIGMLPAVSPRIVGGEMEAMGALATADTDELGWIVVKGISDFAERETRSKIASTRGPAARAAADVVIRVLQAPATL